MMRYVILIALLLCLPVRGEAWQVVGEVVGDGAPSAIPVAFDTFTVSALTDLEDHLADSGHSWIKLSVGVVGIEIQSADDALSYSSGAVAAARYRLSYTPADANYSTEATYSVLSLSGSTIGLAARLDSSADTYYMCRILPETQKVQIIKTVSSATTFLGESSATISVGVDYVLKFSVSGTSLKCSLDGVEKVSVTNGDITAANYVGVRAYSEPSGMLVKDLYVYE